MFEEKGSSAFNAPSSSGLSFFQEAFLKENKEAVHEIKSLAKTHKFQLPLEWTPPDNKVNNLLIAVLSRTSRNRIQEALNLVQSEVVPFNRASAVIRDAFVRILTEYPDVMEHALSEDLFIRKACDLKVHIGFVNQKLREDKAVHINTSNTFLEWAYVNDPDCLEQGFRDQNLNTIEELEKNGDGSTISASLNYVCIENAALVGMNGILRPLLAYDAAEHVFKTTVVKWVILYKWFKIWKKKFIMSARFYVTFLVVFSIYVTNIGASAEISNESTTRKTFLSVLLLLVAYFGLKMFLEEFTQIKSFVKDGFRRFENWKWAVDWGVRYFFKSRWSWLDVASCLLLSAFIPVFHFLALFSTHYEHWLTSLIAVEAVLASVKVIGPFPFP